VSGANEGSTSGASRIDQPGAVTVLVVDDSPIVRRLVTAAFEGDSTFEVVGEAANGRQAVEQAVRLGPSLIVMDLEMPEMDGLAAIGEIMARAPTRILVMTSHAIYRGRDARREARARGALEIIPKPSPGPGGSPEHGQLRQLARLLATVPVLPHVEEARRKRRAARASTQAAPTGPSAPSAPRPSRFAAPPLLRPVALRPVALRPVAPRDGRRPPARARRGPGVGIGLVAIGASTGGPGVLKEMLEALPEDFAAPLVIVQHISEIHAQAFVTWLGRGARLRVVEALPGTRLDAGTAYVALRGGHVVVAPAGRIGGSGGWLEACDEPPREGHCPSIDVLFESVARSHGAGAAGVLLTGMGRDGAHGLLRMREAGGVTLVQDEATSSIFGMPRMALRLGAAQRTVARQDLAGALVQVVGDADRLARS
jgi:two-component system chemotaxis response regulator CheB